MTYAQIMRQFGIGDGSATGHVTKLLKLGQVVKRGGTCRFDPAVFYAPGKAPAAVIRQPTKNAIREANRGLDHKQPTIIPKGLKVTKCPGADPGARFSAKTAPSIINAQDSRAWVAAVTTNK